MVGAGGTCTSHLSDNLTLVDRIANRYVQRRVVGVVGYISVFMLYLYKVSVSVHPASVDNCSALSGVNILAVGAADIYTLVI